MEKNFLQKEVTRCNVNILIINILCLLFSLFVIIFSLPDSPILAIIFMIVLLISIYYFYILYGRFKDYRTHPLYIRFSRFENPLKISELIENELNNKVIYTRGNWIITEQWMIEKSSYDFFAVHRSEIVWVYPTETHRSVNFVPTGTTYSISVMYNLKTTNIKGGIQILGQISSEKSMDTLNIIERFAPWAIYGFDKQIQELWQNKPDIMIQKVNEAYQQFAHMK